MSHAPKEITIETPRGQIGGLVWGEGVPFLGLHGWLDNANTFATLAPKFKNIQLIAVDLPGHGKSYKKPWGASYFFIDHVTEVLDIAKALNLNRFGIIGHSMGAGIASLLAGALGDSITHTILLEGIGPLTREGSGTTKAYADAYRLDRALQPEDKIFPNWNALVETRKRLGGLLKSSASLLMERGTEKLEGGRYRLLRDVRLTTPSLLRMTEAQVQDFLQSITSPTLLLEAEQGTLSHFPVGERIKSVKTLRFEKCPGRHHFHLDNPDEVFIRIEKFFAEFPL